MKSFRIVIIGYRIRTKDLPYYMVHIINLVPYQGFPTELFVPRIVLKRFHRTVQTIQALALIFTINQILMIEKNFCGLLVWYVIDEFLKFFGLFALRLFEKLVKLDSKKWSRSSQHKR